MEDRYQGRVHRFRARGSRSDHGWGRLGAWVARGSGVEGAQRNCSSRWCQQGVHVASIQLGRDSSVVLGRFAGLVRTISQDSDAVFLLMGFAHLPQRTIIKHVMTSLDGTNLV